MRSRLVAITGYAGAGKSSLARQLVDRHGFTLVKFADTLKAMLRCCGLGHREIEGDLKEVPCALLGGRTPRLAMQTLGTEWGRNTFGEDFWVNITMRVVDDVLDNGGSVVIDDARFPNEAAAIRVAGGRVVRILRPGVGAASDHPSENQALPADWLIENHGTLEDLARHADVIAARLSP